MWGEFFDMNLLESQQQSVRSARKCQRNWDLSKKVTDEHIEHFIDIVLNAPSKQDEAYFDLYVVKDNKKIKYLMEEHSWGFTMMGGVSDSVMRNPQMGANVIFCFARKYPNTKRNFHKDGTPKADDIQSRRDNAYTSIGVATGMLCFCANQLGYVTGYGKNFGYLEEPDSYKTWCKELGVAEGTELCYSLGIGFPNTDLKHNESEYNTYISGGPVNSKVNTLKTNLTYPSFSSIKKDIEVTII